MKSDFEERIKALEEWRDIQMISLPRTHADLNTRLVNVEEWRIHKDIVTGDLRKKIMDLEAWKCDAKLATAPVLLDRIMALERTMSNAYISDIPPRLKALEEWKRDHYIWIETKINALERWKESVFQKDNEVWHTYPIHLDRRVKDLEEWYDAHHDKIMRLEKWVSDHFPTSFNPCPSDIFRTIESHHCKHCDRIEAEFKAIPKDVWQEIKSLVEKNYSVSMSYKNELIDAIKKIEPEWNP